MVSFCYLTRMKLSDPFFVLSSGEDISLSICQVLNHRNFCNKMWQTMRFSLRVLGDNRAPLGTLEEVQQRNVPIECVCIIILI